MFRRVPLKRVLQEEEPERENLKIKWSKLDESVDKMLKSQRWMIDGAKYYLNDSRTKFIEMGLLPLFGKKPGERGLVTECKFVGFEPAVRIVCGTMAIVFSEEEWREFVGYRSLIVAFFEEEDAEVVLESLSFKDFRLSFDRVSLGGDSFKKIMHISCRTSEIFLNGENVKTLLVELEDLLNYKLSLLKSRNFKTYAKRASVGAVRSEDELFKLLEKDSAEQPANKLCLIEYYCCYVKNMFDK